MLTASSCCKSEILSLKSSRISMNFPDFTLSTSFGSVAGERLRGRVGDPAETDGRPPICLDKGLCDDAMRYEVNQDTVVVSPCEVSMRGTEATADTGGRMPRETGVVVPMPG